MRSAKLKRSGLILLFTMAFAWPAMELLMPSEHVQPSAQELPRKTPVSSQNAISPSEFSDVGGLGLSGVNFAAALERSNPLWSIPLATLAATRERPLFARTRRPPPNLSRESDAIRTSRQLGRPSLGLVGVIASDEEGMAILRDNATKVIVRLKTGETHSGWTLQAVQGREALLQRGRETAVLTLPNPPGK